MMFIIKRVDDGKYATKPGSEKSYSKNLKDARVFDTRSQAERERCSNEIITTVREEMGA